jgi:hypothetical protein
MNHRFAHEKELILFSDESIDKGQYYSNFYGGVLVGASQYQRINQKLKDTESEFTLKGEIKWSKMSSLFLDGYKAMMDAFFEEIVQENLRVRIMFRQNANVPDVPIENLKNSYFLLYYQFIKHGFQLDKIPHKGTPINLRLYFDQFPDKKEKIEEFKDFLIKMQDVKLKESPVQILKENITEVHSHKHLLLQCLDVVLGSMAFRLNDMHKIKPIGQHFRGKRTIAKEKLYKYILSLIYQIKPNFNIGVSTGGGPNYPNRDDLPYAHWSFKPKSRTFDITKTKGK